MFRLHECLELSTPTLLLRGGPSDSWLCPCWPHTVARATMKGLPQAVPGSLSSVALVGAVSCSVRFRWNFDRLRICDPTVIVVRPWMRPGADEPTNGQPFANAQARQSQTALKQLCGAAVRLF